jgi:hypothetical protein
MEHVAGQRHLISASLGNQSKIAFWDRGNFTLREIHDMIISNDTECIDELLKTIDATINAKTTKLHVIAVKLLYGKSIILGGLLFGKEFPRKAELEAAFVKLSKYANEGLSLH